MSVKYTIKTGGNMNFREYTESDGRIEEGTKVSFKNDPNAIGKVVQQMGDRSLVEHAVTGGGYTQTEFENGELLIPA